MKFTLVTTIFNEISRLNDSIRDIENQTLLPDEIVITDAGSNDGTYERLIKWKSESNIPVVVLQEKGCNIARGRNLAIEKAGYNLIVSTDFGCRYYSEWLESLVLPFKNDKELMVTGGTFKVITGDLNTWAAKADFVLQNGFVYNLDDTYSVSSRSIAYKKEVWEEIGGYQEWLTLAADDTIFWRQIKKHKFNYKIVDKPYVYWGRHKKFIQFAKESSRYGLGDGEAGINFKNFISNSIETSFRYLFVIYLIILALTNEFSLWKFLLLTFLIFGLRSYKNAFVNWWKQRSSHIDIVVLFAAFWMIELTRFYYLKAYVKGWLFASSKQKQQRRKLQIA